MKLLLTTIFAIMLLVIFAGCGSSEDAVNSVIADDNIETLDTIVANETTDQTIEHYIALYHRQYRL